MKNTLIALSLAAITMSNSYAQAENKTNGACASVLCLAGILLGGSADTACDAPINKYFNIKEYDDSGFSPALTSNSRMAFLQQCPQGKEQHNLINAKYGALFDAPSF